MFAESFLINLCIFLAGQLVAYGYLRTGRRHRGLALMFISWILVDAILVVRYALESTDSAEVFYRLLLTLMQTYALVELFLYLFGRWRRRSPKVRQAREVDFRQAYLHYLRNELAPAEAAYRRILRRDAWDQEAMLGLATVQSRAGKGRQARAYFRRARSLDLQNRFGDAIGAELVRFSAKVPPAKP